MIYDWINIESYDPRSMLCSMTCNSAENIVQTVKQNVYVFVCDTDLEQNLDYQT